MRQTKLIAVLLGGTLAVSGCIESQSDQAARALNDVNVIDETNLNDVMLTAADPAEAVTYFRRTSRSNPDRIDLQRGLAKSLVRSGRIDEAVISWSQVIEHEESTKNDSIEYASALVRAGDWKKAEAVLDQIPPTHETYERYRLEAMIADSNQEWDKSDSFYETASDLTDRPANVLNNWGFSKLTRGDFAGAERLFTEAITYDRDLFTAKNNLVLSRAAQRNYALPIIPMNKTEQAQLMHTAALSAIKQGDTDIGRGLLEDAIETHPRHFDEAVRALRAMSRRG